MTTTTSTLDIIRQHVGRRHQITREQMRAILAALEAQGLDLRNPYVAGSLTTDAPTAWERACRGITVVSVDARGSMRDGYVRYDEPGSMHPMQCAELLFAPAALREYEHDQIGQLRRHAERVLLVSGEPSRDPDPPAREPAKVDCPNGHIWTPIDGDDQRLAQGYALCPTCGEGWV